MWISPGPAGTSQCPEKQPGITGGLRSHLGACLGGSRLTTPPGTREMVAGKILQGGPDPSPLLFYRLLQGQLLPGSQTLLWLREPWLPAGGVKSRRSQAPASVPAWKRIPGMGLCPGKSWKDVWDRGWISLPRPVTCWLAPTGDSVYMHVRVCVYLCSDGAPGGSRVLWERNHTVDLVESPENPCKEILNHLQYSDHRVELATNPYV